MGERAMVGKRGLSNTTFTQPLASRMGHMLTPVLNMTDVRSQLYHGLVNYTTFLLL